MKLADARVERLLCDGVAAFGATFDLVPDAVRELWAVRDEHGAVVDLRRAAPNPAVDRMTGVTIERSVGRRLPEESPRL
jgi:hypothetical protein